MRHRLGTNPEELSTGEEYRTVPFLSCKRPSRVCRNGGRQWGYSLVELIIAMAILVTVAAIAVPSYREMVDKAKVVAAMGDIRQIQFEIDNYYLTTGSYPDSLAQVNQASRRDPWGQPYQYLRIAGGDANPRGKVKGCRKDKNLVPLNNDYDLFSMGSDKDYQAPITAKASWDDIIRANNGSFIGLAKNY